MFIVYRLINHTKKEVYHGITQDLHQRLNSSHCVGETKALSHWKCGVDKITAQTLSKHIKQPIASEVAHNYEATFISRKGYRNIRTAGK
jgi:predicted GIY-YIG superfamily endonuclease